MMSVRAAPRLVSASPSATGILLAPAQAAERLAVSRSMIYKLVRTGALSAIYVGRLPRIAEFELEAYLQRQAARAVVR